MSLFEETGSRAASGEAKAPHIVDVLIEERAKGLRSDPLLWPLIRRFLYPVLRYRTALRMADEIGTMGGVEAMDHMSRLLRLNVDMIGAPDLPATGPLVVVCNHPTGIVDGIAVYDALKTARPDLAFFANSDAIRVSPRFDEVLIPVEWAPDKRSRAKTRRTLKSTAEAFEAERAVIIFPSGRLAYMNRRGAITERPWLTSAVTLARRHKAPILPLHIYGRNSWLYYFFCFTSPELRDMTLFHEVLNKKGARYRLRFGDLLDPADLPDDAEAATSELQALVEIDLGGRS